MHVWFWFTTRLFSAFTFLCVSGSVCVENPVSPPRGLFHRSRYRHVFCAFSGRAASLVRRGSKDGTTGPQRCSDDPFCDSGVGAETRAVRSLPLFPRPGGTVDIGVLHVADRMMVPEPNSLCSAVALCECVCDGPDQLLCSRGRRRALRVSHPCECGPRGLASSVLRPHVEEGKASGAGAWLPDGAWPAGQDAGALKPGLAMGTPSSGRRLDADCISFVGFKQPHNVCSRTQHEHSRSTLLLYVFDLLLNVGAIL